MTPDTPSPPQLATVDISLAGEGFQLQARVTVPAGPTRVSELLPLARALSDNVVREASRAVEKAGGDISCKMGCGACCRNLVVISEVEARRMRVVVDNLPEPRRSEIRARFAAARRGFEQAGLLDALQHPERWTDDDYGALVGAYFQQGIPCPFLEEESCSIYAERPITCREYLVTSPPEHCARLGSQEIRRVPLPLVVFNAVARWQTPPTEHLLERVVTLILALEWAESHPDDPPPQPGLDLLRELLDHLKTKP